ncbi:MAG TPA: hypothetical protein VF103_12305, partial [Polyangiaceae bacterium]
LGGAGGRFGGGGSAGCDVGCERTTQGPGSCDAGQAIWTCRNQADLMQFNQACDILPSGLPRYCCPVDFTPTCN